MNYHPRKVTLRIYHIISHSKRCNFPFRLSNQVTEHECRHQARLQWLLQRRTGKLTQLPDPCYSTLPVSLIFIWPPLRPL